MRYLMQERVMERAGCVLLLLFYHTCSGLEVTVPSSQTSTFQTPTLLPCTFRLDNPSIENKFLAIFWHFGNKQLLRYDSKEMVSSPGVSMDREAIKQGNASLSIHNVTISDQGKYKCLVIYSPNKQEKEIQLYVLAAPVVKITKKALVRDEENRLQCSITDFFPRDITVKWLRNGQALNGSVLLEFQENADGTYNVNSSVTITPIQTKDNPLITCWVEHESLRDPIQDDLRVEYGAAPIVRVISSKTPDDNEQIYLCEARGYFPEDVAITWLLDGKRNKPPRGSVNGLFNKEMYYRIRLNEDNRPTQISCEVQHETLHSPITETLEVVKYSDCKKSCHTGLPIVLLVLVILLSGILLIIWYLITKKKYFQQFQVSHIQREPSRTDDEMVTVHCMASNCKKDVQVTWSVIETDGKTVTVSDSPIYKDEESGRLLGSDYTVRTDQSQSDKLYNVITALSFKPIVSKHKDIEIVCNFLCDGRNQKRSMKCSFAFKKPEVPAPIKLSLCDSGDVLCSVDLKKFYPGNIKIKWSSGVGHYQDLETIKNRIISNSEYTFNITSECRVPGHLFKDPGFRVRVTWIHLDESESREVSATDFPWIPVMDDIIKLRLVQGIEAKLQCRISRYFPGDLDVKWLRREAGNQDLYEVSPNDKYKIPEMEITQESDKTYTCTAGLIVSVSAVTEHGSEFICRMRHPTLETVLEKRTGELSVAGIPTVNIIHLKKSLRAEILHFFPKDITVYWSRLKNNEYKKYHDKKDYKNKLLDNNDDTFTCISDFSLKGNHKKKFYKVTVEHETLKPSIEKTILYEKGVFHLMGNGDEKTIVAEHSGEKENSNVENQVSDEGWESRRTGEDTMMLQENKDVEKKKRKQKNT